MISETELKAQLANTESLFAHIHHFDCEINGFAVKSTKGAAITYSDLLERRSDFVKELKNSICNWVYSKSKFRSMLQDELMQRGYDMPNAVSQIVEMARSKFRKDYPRGQFGELLLFNFLQHYYNAPAILRKMPITTNPSVERHGADAIHLGLEGGNPVLYLGEAKTYTSKYKFEVALEASIDSILKAHAQLHDELDLYVYDEFIEHPFQDIAKKYKRGQIDIEIQLVSLISYTETKVVSGIDAKSIKETIATMVRDRLKSTKKTIFSKITPNVISRMHFFLLPFWDLEDLLKSFES